MSIEDNYIKVFNSVKTLNSNSTLIAVSKTKSIEDIKKLYDLGQRDFGENRVQELLEKYEILPKDIRWHFIGHLQTNKVKYIIDKVHLIQSIDSLTLAEVINKEAKKNSRVVDVLIQINFAEDPNKFGFLKDEYMKAITRIAKFENLSIKGIMMIPFIDMEECELEKLFQDFTMLKLDIEAKKIDNVSIKFLSFGMSDDYKVALKNGSNMVRVGSAIFGSR